MLTRSQTRGAAAPARNTEVPPPKFSGGVLVFLMMGPPASGKTTFADARGLVEIDDADALESWVAKHGQPPFQFAYLGTKHCQTRDEALECARTQIGHLAPAPAVATVVKMMSRSAAILAQNVPL